MTKSNQRLFVRGGMEARMFAKLPPVKKWLYPFALSVLVLDPDLSPRHPMFELFVDRGMDTIDDLLNQKPLRAGDALELTFFFPERRMCPEEQRIFLLMSHAFLWSA